MEIHVFIGHSGSMSLTVVTSTIAAVNTTLDSEFNNVEERKKDDGDEGRWQGGVACCFLS